LTNYTNDLDKTDQILGEQTLMNNEMKFAEINEDINEGQSETLYKYYRYFNHLDKIQTITDANRWIIKHLSKQDAKTKEFIFTNATVDFSNLYYVSPNHLADLVEEMNKNPNIKKVKFNLSLMRHGFRDNYQIAMKYL
jgi:hypothetical protein